MIKSPWKNVADPAEVETATSWSPVGCQSNWATEAGNSKSTKARVVILVGHMPSCPVLHFYHISSKCCEEYLSYRADTKSNSNTRRGGNSQKYLKKASVVILVSNTLSHLSTFLPSKIKIIQTILPSSQNLLYWCRTAVRQTIIFCRTDKYLQDWRHICCQNIICFAKIYRTFVRQTKWKNASFVRQSCTFREDFIDRADKKSNSNTRRGDNSKSKKA